MITIHIPDKILIRCQTSGVPVDQCVDPDTRITKKVALHQHTYTGTATLYHIPTAKMSDAKAPKPVSVLFVCLGNICTYPSSSSPSFPAY
jgi:hypothetical protein